jgi:hypothetical protein
LRPNLRQTSLSTHRSNYPPNPPPSLTSPDERQGFRLVFAGRSFINFRAAVEAPSPRVAKRNGERYGEGPVARALPLGQGRENGVTYAVDLLVDLIIGETNDPIALALHECRPPLILRDFLGRRVGGAVDFHD